MYTCVHASVYMGVQIHVRGRGRGRFLLCPLQNQSQACPTGAQSDRRACRARRVQTEGDDQTGWYGRPSGKESGAPDTTGPGQSLTFYGILEKWVQEGSGGAMIQPQPEKQNPETKSTAHIS